MHSALSMSLKTNCVFPQDVGPATMHVKGCLSVRVITRSLFRRSLSRPLCDRSVDAVFRTAVDTVPVLLVDVDTALVTRIAVDALAATPPAIPDSSRVARATRCVLPSTPAFISSYF